MFCPRLSKNFPFSFYLFQNAWKLQNWSVFRKIIKRIYKNDLVATKMAFSTKFALAAKEQNNGFWNISNLRLCCNSVVLNINFKSEYAFWKTKSTENVNSKGLGWVRNQNVFPQTIMEKVLQTNSRN